MTGQYKHEHVLTDIKIWGESVKQLVSRFLNQQHQLVSFDKAPVYCYINEANSVEALSLPSA